MFYRFISLMMMIFLILYDFLIILVNYFLLTFNHHSINFFYFNMQILDFQYVSNFCFVSLSYEVFLNQSLVFNQH